jgi:hypothetical protein
MQRRISVRGVALGATLAVGATVTPVEAEAQQVQRKGTAPAATTKVQAAPTKAAMRQVQFNGSNFQATAEQVEAFNALPESVKAKLKPGANGAIMPIEELRSLRELAVRIEGGTPLIDKDRVAASTVMCPW